MVKKKDELSAGRLEDNYRRNFWSAALIGPWLMANCTGVKLLPYTAASFASFWCNRIVFCFLSEFRTQT